MKLAYRIELDGVDVTEKWGAVFSGIEVTDEAGIRADTCEITFDNREQFTAPPIDAELKVWLGYEPTPVYMGRYKISSWEKAGPTRILTVSARAADLTTEIKARKTRSWHEKTVKQIVETIAGEHRLGSSIDAAVGERTIDHIDQQTESDMAFLTRLAKRQGATFKLGDGKILFVAKGSKTLPSGRAKSSVAIKPVDCSDWQVRHEERGNYKSVITFYVDKTTKKHVQVTAGSGKPAHRDPRQYGSAAEALAAANASMGDLNRGKLSGSISGLGNPNLFAEAVIKLEGFDPDVDGEYLAKSVAHSFSKRGYTTSVQFETIGGATKTAAT